jgi:ABC-type dipeptide/oligopeptide/nickel transport system ATPase component
MEPAASDLAQDVGVATRSSGTAAPALDVSVHAVILKLLESRRLGMSYFFVSHGLNVVRLLADRVLLMYLGRIVETRTVDEVFERPRHPYTRALLSCVPAPGPAGARRCICLTGERCAREMPLLRSYGGAHVAACHRA